MKESTSKRNVHCTSNTKLKNDGLYPGNNNNYPVVTDNYLGRSTRVTRTHVTKSHQTIKIHAPHNRLFTLFTFFLTFGHANAIKKHLRLGILSLGPCSSLGTGSQLRSIARLFDHTAKQTAWRGKQLRWRTGLDYTTII